MGSIPTGFELHNIWTLRELWLLRHFNRCFCLKEILTRLLCNVLSEYKWKTSKWSDCLVSDKVCEKSGLGSRPEPVFGTRSRRVWCSRVDTDVTSDDVTQQQHHFDVASPSQRFTHDLTLHHSDVTRHPEHFCKQPRWVTCPNSHNLFTPYSGPRNKLWKGIFYFFNDNNHRKMMHGSSPINQPPKYRY